MKKNGEEYLFNAVDWTRKTCESTWCIRKVEGKREGHALGFIDRTKRTKSKTGGGVA